MSMIGWFHLRVRLEFDQNTGIYERDSPSLPIKKRRKEDWVMDMGWRMPNKAGKRDYADLGEKRKLLAEYRDLFGIDKLVITARGRTLVAGKFREWGE